jgi:hypothetical protein
MARGASYRSIHSETHQAGEITKQDQIHAKMCLFHAEFLDAPTPDPVGTIASEPKDG